MVPAGPVAAPSPGSLCGGDWQTRPAPPPLRPPPVRPTTATSCPGFTLKLTRRSAALAPKLYRSTTPCNSRAGRPDANPAPSAGAARPPPLLPTPSPPPGSWAAASSGCASSAFPPGRRGGGRGGASPAARPSEVSGSGRAPSRPQPPMYCTTRSIATPSCSTSAALVRRPFSRPTLRAGAGGIGVSAAAHANPDAACRCAGEPAGQQPHAACRGGRQQRFSSGDGASGSSGGGGSDKHSQQQPRNPSRATAHMGRQ